MKFLLVTYEYPPVGGGTGKVAQAFSRALVKRGHEVTILTSLFKGLDREEIDHGVKIIRIRVLRKYLNLARPWEVLSFALAGLLRVRGLQREEAPDRVLCFFTIPCSMVGYGFKLFYKTPYMSFLLGQDVPGFKDTPPDLFTITKPVIKFLWRRSQHVIANSHSLAAMAQNTLPTFPFGVMTNAVDPEIYKPAQTQRNATPTLLFIGRLREFKGIPDLIHAFSQLKNKHSALKLRIAGFGPERPNLEAQVEELALTENVRFLGRLDEAQVIAELQSATIFINPSYDEGMPSAVLEAMACATPTVVSDIKPHLEMICDGQNGLVFTVQNSDALTAQLDRLLRDSSLRERIGQQARRTVLEHFTWDAKAAQFLRDFIRP